MFGPPNEQAYSFEDSGFCALFQILAPSDQGSELELDHFAELEIELKKIFFLNSNSHKTVRVHSKDI